MKNGRCTKCGSDKVYSSIDGITSGGDNTIVRHTGLFSSYPERVNYICTDCGYYENYIENMRILEKIATKWNKV